MQIDPLAALAFGTVVGFGVQYVAAVFRYGPAWKKVPGGRKLTTSAAGSIAAWAVGLWVLSHPNPRPEVPFYFGLWFWQTVSAWLGAVLLDAIGEILKAMVARYGGEGK